jgi:hypothetical protein
MRADKSFGRPGHAPTLASVQIDLSPDGKTVTGFKWLSQPDI